MSHTHYLHKEVAYALKKTSRAFGVEYEVIKDRFAVEHDLEVTVKFWEFFNADNKNVKPTGVQYCHFCEKFNISNHNHPSLHRD